MVILPLSNLYHNKFRQMPSKKRLSQVKQCASPLPPASGETASGQGNWYLIKSEPDEFSIDDLKSRPDGTAPWDGVRNAQAKNFLKTMKIGDKLFFYHSSCKVPGIVGVAHVVNEAYPDHTAWDPSHKYFDIKSCQSEPKWFMVDIKYHRSMSRLISLEELKTFKDKQLSGMLLMNRPRLSVQPVNKEHANFILELENKALDIDLNQKQKRQRNA